MSEADVTISVKPVRNAVTANVTVARNGVSLSESRDVSVITDHSLLSNLDYASSGHTGFQREDISVLDSYDMGSRDGLISVYDTATGKAEKVTLANALTRVVTISDGDEIPSGMAEGDYVIIGR